MFRMLADFNDVRDDCVSGLAEDVENVATDDTSTVCPGDLVLIRDGGGEEALGVVQSITDGLVRALVEWDTFGEAGRFSFMPPRFWVSLGEVPDAQEHAQPQLADVAPVVAIRAADEYTLVPA